MIKTFFWLVFSVITFAMGFYFGEQRLFRIPHSFSGIQSGLSSQTTHLEHTIKGIRLWMALNDSKDHLSLASVALDEKNFGSAVYEVKEARTKLEKAEGLSQGELKKQLRPLNQLMSDTEVSLAQFNPKAKKQVESAKLTLEKIISK